MKKLLSIIFLLISIQSFAQNGKAVIKVQGTPGVYNISKVGDSIVYYVRGIRYAVSVGTVADLSKYYDTTGIKNLLGKKVDTSYHDIINVFAPFYSKAINDSINELHAYMSTDSTFANATDTTLASSLAIKAFVTNRPPVHDDLRFNYLLNGDTSFKANPVGWDQAINHPGNTIYDGHQYIMTYSGYTPPLTKTNTYVGYVTSPDNKTWTKHGKIASVPLQDPFMVYYNGTYYLYADDISVDPFTGISLHTSTDLISWTDHGIVLNRDITNLYEKSDVSSPTLYVENGVFYLFYTERNLVGADSAKHAGSIGLATSTDGINFTKSSQNPLIQGTGTPFFAPERGDIKWATNIYSDDIFKVEDKYYMTFHGYDSASLNFKTGMAISKDMYHWRDYLGSWISRQTDVEDIGEVMVYWNGKEFLPRFTDSANTSYITGSFAIKNDFNVGSKGMATSGQVTFSKYVNTNSLNFLSTNYKGDLVLQPGATASDTSNQVRVPYYKKWVLFGDSFSSNLAAGYPPVVIKKMNLTGTATNAVPGNKIAQQSAKLDSILAANPTYFNSFDIASIFIGINDFANNTQLGTISDSANQATYAGKLKHMIETILAAKPNIELYVVTPPEGNGAGVSYKAANSLGWTVQQMAKLISQICYSYSVQCIDVYSYSQFNLKTIPTLTSDGLHPNTLGGGFIGNMIASAFVNRTNVGIPDFAIDSAANKTYVRLNGNDTIAGTKTFNNAFQTNANTINYWGDGLAYGLLSYDVGKAIMGALTGKVLSLYSGGAEQAILDMSGNFKLTAAGAKLSYASNPTMTPADSMVTPNKKYVDSSITYQPYVNTSVSISASLTNKSIEVTATGQTITLPTAVGITGKEYRIKLTSSGSCTIATTGSQTIDASTTYSLSAQYKYVTVQSNGSNWVIIGNN
jgi:predicted GH43/DUF377 family glycosyl hydrolase/lysophospholipase L1-like esterase